MRTDIAGWLALVVVGLSAGGAVAQPERYELGQRLKRFEQEWECRAHPCRKADQTDPAVLKRALTIVKKASGQFLSLQLGEAGRTLDEARHVLMKQPPSETERWLDSIWVRPERLLIDASARELSVEVRQFYRKGKVAPPDAAVYLCFDGGPKTPVPLDRLPIAIKLQFPETPNDGNYFLSYELVVNEQPVRTETFAVRKNMRLADGVAALNHWSNTTDRIDPQVRAEYDLEIASLKTWIDDITHRAAGDIPETDADWLRCDTLAEFGIMLPLTGRFFVADPFDHVGSITIPTAGGIRTPCRFMLRNEASRPNPVPLVVALHGAGGSENLFFEGYGNGHIVKECEKRGWMLLAPRGGLIGAAPVAAIIDKLAERYPIDPKRIFLVGHSMGAGQAIELAQQHPGKFAAVASLGGAGRVRKKEAFADLPVFVGVGDQDFALKGSRALHQALTDAGARRVTYKEYPDLEHLIIVREALPDVFAAWDEIAKK